jgi:uncharacterized protein YdaU (DUF1376 family)
MPDLTRFDFHAVRFMNSEDVEEMSAAEVGQYILLLCKAWLIGKDTTLPLDLVKLARYARTESLSEAVLAHFPIVETEFGDRRRNNVLYSEWMEACLRSETGRNKANKRWEAKPLVSGDDTTADATANATPMPGPMPSPYRTEPIHSNHTNPSQTIVESCQDEFRIFKQRFKQWVRANLSGDKRTRADYAKYQQQYGAEVILECLEEWANKNGEWASTIKFPASAFWKVLPEYAETAIDVIEARKEQEEQVAKIEQQKVNQERAQADSITRQTQEIVQRMRATPQQNEESLDDFLKE